MNAAARRIEWRARHDARAQGNQARHLRAACKAIVRTVIRQWPHLWHMCTSVVIEHPPDMANWWTRVDMRKVHPVLFRFAPGGPLTIRTYISTDTVHIGEREADHGGRSDGPQ